MGMRYQPSLFGQDNWILAKIFFFLRVYGPRRSQPRFPNFCYCNLTTLRHLITMVIILIPKFQSSLHIQFAVPTLWYHLPSNRLVNVPIIMVSAQPIAQYHK